MHLTHINEISKSSNTTKSNDTPLSNDQLTTCDTMQLDDYQTFTPHNYEISNSGSTIRPTSPISLNDISMNTDITQIET